MHVCIGQYITMPNKKYELPQTRKTCLLKVFPILAHKALRVCCSFFFLQNYTCACALMLFFKRKSIKLTFIKNTWFTNVFTIRLQSLLSSIFTISIVLLFSPNTGYQTFNCGTCTVAFLSAFLWPSPFSSNGNSYKEYFNFNM